MDKQEFYLLIPGIIYGVAIVNLLSIFRKKKPYWELVLWGVYIFFTLIFLWTELFEKLPMMVEKSHNFLLIVIQSVLYAQMTFILTPDEEIEDTRTYFLKHKRAFFLLGALSVSVNYLMQILVYEDQRPSWVRPSLIILSFICAFYDKVWVRTLAWTFVFALALGLIFFPQLPGL